MTALPRPIRLALALAAALALSWTAGAGEATARDALGEAESLAPHLLLIHGGSFLYEDPGFQALTEATAREAGFVPHYLTYPLSDLRGAVLSARAEARRLGRLYPGRLYAYGSSAGGTLAALLAGDGLVRAAVAKAPPSDLLGWTWPLGAYGPDYFEQLSADDGMRRRLSPLRRPARRPLLLVHGRGDGVVPAAMSEAFAAKFGRVHLWLLGGGHHLERVRPAVLEGAFGWLAGSDAMSR